MAFYQASEWHEGETAIHRRTHVDTGDDDPTNPFLSPQAANMIQRYPMMAIGTLDEQDRPWCTVWGTDQTPMSQPVAQSIIGIRSTVDASFDPVVRAIYRGKDDGEIVREEGEGRMLSALSIHLEQRGRVKLAGRIVAGALTASHAAEEKDETKAFKDAVKTGKPGDVQLVVKINQSLGNCPKYLNRKQIVAHTPRPKLLSTSPHLTERARELIRKADLFFIASAHKHEDMDCNHRGGPAGFIRLLEPRDPEDTTTIVWPEYSGNNLYQTLGNLETTPHAGLVIPDFETGDVLYVTGDTETLVGTEAANLIAKSNLAVQLKVTAAVFVENGLPFRGRLMDDASLGRSPYNPKVRYLTSEKTDDFSNIGDDDTSAPTTAQLIRKTRLTPTITRYRFSLSDPGAFGPWKPGQYVALDLAAELKMGYSHMRDDDPTSLNDDYIRTFTVSSVPNALGEHGEEFEVTVRRVGSVTKWLERQREGMCEVGVRGFGGEFRFERGGARNAFVAAGIGITPLLGQLGELDLTRTTVLWSVGVKDVALPLDLLTQYPALRDSIVLFLTGDETRSGSGGKEKAQLTKLLQTGVRVERRRLAREDVLGVDAKGVDNWYLCTAPGMRKTVQSWMPGKTIVFENFDY